ncbi:hypothetical protein [Luteipulveratus mongoliensis]|uniref:Uncharacterized protein n=1 Tax=Luteipulveratus mongoliensis TaxID=571913 RepID=A0A0K1JEW2_9MICO|nr:hypothetical protein [Luteipulveratus mongoliensis]AKU15252.1 hypothetical protein VV02_04220 [Luteipulveratus mongoliensis]
MFQFNEQQSDAEVAHRHQRIARDEEITHDWEIPLTLLAHHAAFTFGRDLPRPRHGSSPRR